MLRSWWIAGMLVVSGVAFADSDSDTAEDTDSVDTSGWGSSYTASELAGEEGGSGCTHVGGVGGLALVAAAAALTRRR